MESHFLVASGQGEKTHPKSSRSITISSQKSQRSSATQETHRPAPSLPRVVLIIDGANAVKTGSWNEGGYTAFEAMKKLRDQLALLHTTGIYCRHAHLGRRKIHFNGGSGVSLSPPLKIILIIEGDFRGISSTEFVQVVDAYRSGDQKIVDETRIIVNRRKAHARRGLRDTFVIIAVTGDIELQKCFRLAGGDYWITGSELRKMLEMARKEFNGDVGLISSSECGFRLSQPSEERYGLPVRGFLDRKLKGFTQKTKILVTYKNIGD